MTGLIGQWRHVFKLDPDRELSDEALEKVCTSGTDAILVGGSSGVTYDNTVDLMSRIRRFAVPCVLEISTDEALVPGFDLYFIPIVLNTDQGEWICGRHQEALREAGAHLEWDRIAAEGYVILNEDSTAAKLTGARAPATLKDLTAYARMADRLFSLPIFYVEYSGTFGNMEWVRQTRNVLQRSRLFYGGGIDGPDKAREAAQAAHTIVVGNAVYENLSQALATVDAVRKL
ncbi:heptaprenylglyceryl phosphate synthase [Gorillibacterium sp. sgz5001074]|uniref:heptaprenylglyceryl phosphate synthase n=1 Tax=Gorillibacterium sp. sgz5001074 TaxID=3446695 RepID=UPI003F674E41